MLGVTHSVWDISPADETFAFWKNGWLRGLVMGSGGFHIGSDLTLVSDA
jgi:hypothetical protein